MNNLIPQLSLLTTAAGALMCPPWRHTRTAPATQSSTALPDLRPPDQLPRLRNLHPV